MRLSSLKLVGFKSFVDPTNVPFPKNLTAIVGPNGCGKSNIVDAIRWVMGETSAKHLRGEAMSDVIFNGSTGRKPVGQASVELVFDNSDGSVGGEYAKYAEISIKRQVSRDGQSNYFLNNTKCRRKDVQDVFLGTGIGTRNSYSIIEQGMISRFIEAKPDDLRLFLEEAAGVSKYKERRRETETRIRHTRENLERLEDVREEVAKQIEHLQRQAKAAEKYKVLKQEERLLKAQLLALHWQDMDFQINNHDSVIKEQQVRVEERIAEHRRIEAEIEKHRQQQIEYSDDFNAVQARYYGLGSEIARLEQTIAHHRERFQQLQADQKQVEQAWQELTSHLAVDQENLAAWRIELADVEPRLAAAKQAEAASSDVLETAEQTMSEWQAQWDSFNQRASQTTQNASVEQTRIQHLQQQITQAEQRLARMGQEYSEINPQAFDNQIAELQQQQQQVQTQVEQQKAALEQVKAELIQQRDTSRDVTEQLDQARLAVQTMRGRQSSLLALQQAAAGSGAGSASAWLESKDLQKRARLAQQLTITDGWEVAVETVLGSYLEAVCVDDVSDYADFASLKQGQVLLFDQGQNSATAESNLAALLTQHVNSDYPVANLLAGVHCVATLPEALALRDQLSANQSVVTKDGIWLGKHWLRVAKLADKQTSVIAREQELKSLTENLVKQAETVASLEAELTAARQAIQNLEQQRDNSQQQLNQQQQKLADANAQLKAQQQNRERVQQRADQLAKDIADNEQSLKAAQEKLAGSEQALAQAQTQIAQDTSERERLAAARGSYREALENAREKAKVAKEQVHSLTLRSENLRTQSQAADTNIHRMQEQLQSVTERREQLREAMQDGESPIEGLQRELQVLLEQQVTNNKQLTEARHKLEVLNEQLQELEKRRQDVIEQVESLRDKLQQAKLDFQTLDVRRATYAEQIAEMNYELPTLLSELPAEAKLDVWEQELQTVMDRIQRLGAINLAAIDEHKVQEERKIYLDAQYADLVEALNTLEDAIKKIDKETKQKFQETFDQVNAGFAHLFPKVFGGGSARLELIGDGILDNGIAVMAQPPGKRNTSIHLLSGGEKALTAISLVFSIFQLNPAPFCLLDEVDAPLDDSNVGRFCNLVKEMSNKVQFIFISHNKLAIEMGEQLTGVTMHEPGVSRIVAVDVAEAVAMATA